MPTEDGYRRLAAAVIIRAIKDANGHLGNELEPKSNRRTIAQDAREFLRADNAMFQTYCDGIDLEPTALLAAIRRNGAEFAMQASRER